MATFRHTNSATPTHHALTCFLHTALPLRNTTNPRSCHMLFFISVSCPPVASWILPPLLISACPSTYSTSSSSTVETSNGCQDSSPWTLTRSFRFILAALLDVYS